MTEERTKEALVESVRVFRNPDGSIEEQTSTVEVRVNYNDVCDFIFDPDDIEYEPEVEELSEKYEPGDVMDTEYQNGAYARLRYSVEDGVARLEKFKDAEPSSGNWVSVEFLRVINATEGVVANVPGVDQVEFAGDTLLRHIDDGEGAEIQPA